MVGYELYATGYLIWYPGNGHMKKVEDVIFHEDDVTPAIPTLYGQDNAPHNVGESFCGSESNSRHTSSLSQLLLLQQLNKSSLYVSQHIQNPSLIALKIRSMLQLNSPLSR